MLAIDGLKAGADTEYITRYAPSASSMYRSGYVCGVFGRKPRIQNHLGGFATKDGEKSGLG